MTKPITPDEVDAHKTRSLPEVVFDAVNALIARHWTGQVSIFSVKAVSDEIKKLSRKGDIDIPAYWLDFEPCYREAGWKVDYEESTYTFTKKKGRAK